MACLPWSIKDAIEKLPISSGAFESEKVLEDSERCNVQNWLFGEGIGTDVFGRAIISNTLPPARVISFLPRQVPTASRLLMKQTSYFGTADSAVPYRRYRERKFQSYFFIRPEK